MADTTFIDNTTIIEADWLNDVNDVVYTDLGGVGGISSTTTGKGASLVGFEPSGDIASTDVQAALEELDSEKVPETDFTTFSKTLVDDSSADEMKDTLRLQVNGITALKALAPVSGERVWLNYHTTEGDGGYGVFRGITEAAAGTYTDDNGVTILPTGGDGSSCWRRELDGYVTPEMFGAVGDGDGAGGGTDDSTAFSNMLSSLSSIGVGKILLGDRTTYRLDTAQTFGDKVSIIGAGMRRSYLDFKNCATSPVLASSSFGTSGSINQYDFLEEFTILGPGKASAIDGIGFSSWSSHIERVQVKSFRRGITIGSSTTSNAIVETHVSWCKIHECDQGIYGVEGGQATDIEVAFNVINACTSECIRTLNSGGYRFIGNNLYNANNLLRMSTVINNTVVVGNYFGECLQTPLFAIAGSGSVSTSLTVTGNVFKTANINATATNDYDKALITIYNSGGDGDFDTVTISGNVLRDSSGNAKHAIYFFGLLNNVVLGPNTYEGSWTTANILRVPSGDLHDRIFINEPGIPTTYNKDGELTGLKRQETWGSAAATSGTWAVGDKVWNRTPSVDGNNMVILGWICTVAGTPGTWQPMYVSTVSPAT